MEASSLMGGGWLSVKRRVSVLRIGPEKLLALLIIIQSYIFTFDLCGSGGVRLVVSAHE